MNINEAKWLEGFAKESLSDQVQTIIEDLSCLGILVAAALENVQNRAELERLRGEVAALKSGHEHCPTCICGKRAPVQGDHGPKGRGPGSITWAEHLLAWSGYAARYGAGQSAERMAERGGFSFDELQTFLGRDPETWEPRAANGAER